MNFSRWKIGVAYVLIFLVSPNSYAQTRSLQTQNLFENLRKLAKTNVLFGHQDDLAYGVHWKKERHRSDIKDVCGDYPALFGWEIGHIGQSEFSLDTVWFKDMRKWIQEAYHLGGVNTISWHLNNPCTGGSSWDNTDCIHDILPGGAYHQIYLEQLEAVGDFIGSLHTGFLSGQRIPVIFRPFHEHSGGWFWWGKGHTSAEDYKTLYRFTVDYLRKDRGLDNVLICYSPDVVADTTAYLEFYPGDDYVDIMGLDDYRDVGQRDRAAELTRRLHFLVELAESHGKIPVLSETGFNEIPDSNWWTEVLWSAIASDPVACRIAYLMVWRNARTNHHFGPFKGHPSANDFIKFVQEPQVLTVSELPDLYH
ncbi:MAG TPA: glycosyl hydrolase [Saprospiraceae bacterium]|nr:glycosyl hydrolase [Saprospiraceae bacterium]